MLDIKLIRENPDSVREALDKRRSDYSMDEVLDLDERRRGLLTEVEGLKARRNEVSKEIGRTGEKPPKLIEEMR
jgi:seryl-tRNA synthetase